MLTKCEGNCDEICVICKAKAPTDGSLEITHFHGKHVHILCALEQVIGELERIVRKRENKM